MKGRGHLISRAEAVALVDDAVGFLDQRWRQALANVVDQANARSSTVAASSARTLKIVHRNDAGEIAFVEEIPGSDVREAR